MNDYYEHNERYKLRDDIYEIDSINIYTICYESDILLFVCCYTKVSYG